MPKTRIFQWLAVFTLLSVNGTQAAEKYLLSESPARGVLARVQLEVRGHLNVHHTPKGSQKQQVKQLPLAIDGELEYRQRLLADQQGRRRAVRHYTNSQGKVVVDGRLFRPQLDEDRQLVQVEVEGERVHYRCPQGPLTREELDVVAVQGNSLLLHRLLPDREVAIGETWAVDGSDAAPLFGLQEAFAAGIQATLKSVEERVAKVHLKGALDGAVDGVSSHIDWEAELLFDLDKQHVTMFDVLFDEKREISGGQPGVKARSHLRVTLEEAGIPASLEDDAIEEFPVAESSELLRFRSPKGEFSLVHTPNWRVITATPRQTTVRLLEGGDVIAQGTLSKLSKLPESQPLTLAAFTDEVRSTLKNLKGEVLQSEQTQLDSGLTLLRVVGAGKVEELEVQWVYLHAANDQGQRVSCVFTLEQKRVEKFQGADLSLLSGLDFVIETARKP